MKTKTTDYLLKELNDVQLSKESMSGIKGGLVEKYTVCNTTKTGELCITYRESDNRILEIRINGHFVFASEIAGGADATAA